MSRLDRLVRSAGARMDDDEVLVASVLGRRSDGRGHAALVATDRRLLLVTEGFTRTMIDEVEHHEVRAFDRLDDGVSATVDVLATEIRWRVQRIQLDAGARVALDLIAARCGPVAGRSHHPEVPARVRVGPAV